MEHPQTPSADPSRFHRRSARIRTMYGDGTIVGREFYSRLHGGTHRFAVDLDNNPFSYSPVYFWPSEIQA